MNDLYLINIHPVDLHPINTRTHVHILEYIVTYYSVSFVSLNTVLIVIIIVDKFF